MSVGGKNQTAIDESLQYLTLDGAGIVRGVLRFTAEFGGIDPVRPIKVEQHHIGG